MIPKLPSILVDTFKKQPYSHTNKKTIQHMKHNVKWTQPRPNDINNLDVNEITPSFVQNNICVASHDWFTKAARGSGFARSGPHRFVHHCGGLLQVFEDLGAAVSLVLTAAGWNAVLFEVGRPVPVRVVTGATATELHREMSERQQIRL